MDITIPAEVWSNIWLLVVTAIGWIVAYLKNTQVKTAVAAASTAEQKTEQTVKFYDSTTDEVPVAPDWIPGRTYKMNDDTKKFILSGESETDRASILQQIADAEAQKLATYQITTSVGYYLIEYGLIRASARGGK